MQSSTVTTSNWDFTPVIDLLRSPTCQGGNQPTLNKPAPDYPVASIASHTITKNDVENSKNEARRLGGANTLLPKLGDFGSLWEFLGSTSNSLVSKVDTVHHETRTDLEESQHSTKPVTILKRPSSTTVRSENAASASKTVLGLRTVPSVFNSALYPPTAKATVEPSILPQNHSRRKNTEHANSSSESTTGAESDSCHSVFDPPFSKAQNTPPMIPPQVGVTEARARPLESPPSSFDDSTEFLTPIIIKHVPSSGIIRIQPLTYRTSADQRAGLLTKLLKSFPEYAELIVQSGRLKKPKNTTISSRPIHVFVDMSNVSVFACNCYIRLI